MRTFILLIALCGVAGASVFTPTAFRIDGQPTAARTGTCTTVTTTVTAVTGITFVSGDVGKGFFITGGTPTVSTIQTFTNGTTVTISPSPGSIGSPASCSILESATYAANGGNGWVLEIDVPTIATGGTYGTFGFSQASNNVPTSPSVILTVTSNGFQGTANGGTCGSATTYTRTVYATHGLRQPYPNPGTLDIVSSGGTTTFRLALNDRIYSSDTVTVQVANSFYTDGSSNTVGTVVAGTAVTNNSTMAYSTARVLFNWTYPGWQRITGASFNVRGTGFSQYPQNSLPIACVVYTATDQHSNSATATVGFPTIDPTMGDQVPVIEYVGSIATGSFTNHDQITVTFKAYPWIGDSTATMDSSDGVFNMPTPIYSKQFDVLDTTNNYSAAGYVDASLTFPGSHTSGTFVAGETVTQSTSSATAKLIDASGANGAGPIHIGAILTGTTNSTNGSTWTGGTSGAVFTQTGAPTFLGDDTSACAAAESGGQPATACRTLMGALIKMAAFNNATSTPTHNDACGTLFMEKGYYNWLGSSSTGSNTTSKCWANLSPASGASRAQVIIQGVGIGSGASVGTKSFGSLQTGSLTNAGTQLRLNGITVNVTTGPTSVFDQDTFLWWDNDILGSGGTAPVFNVTDLYITRSSFTNNMVLGLRPFSTTNASFALVRGSNLNNLGASSAVVFCYTCVGNTHSLSENLSLITDITSQGNPASVMPIIAFNTLYKVTASSNSIMGILQQTSSIIGAAIVQNVAENINANESLAAFTVSADGSTGNPVNNVMIWDTDLVGGRNNRGYNEVNSTILLRQSWSEVGNLMDQIAIKTDTFNGTPQGGRLGNWAEIYGSGYRNNFFTNLTGGSPGWPAAGSFCNEFIGLYTAYGTITGGSTNPPTCTTQSTINYLNYKNRSAFDGTSGNSGGGDYDLLSSSPAINSFISGTNILPYDIAGQLRNNSGWGSAGAYAQEKILTTVFGW